METINKLTDKYFVLKIDDVLRFGNDKEIKQFNDLATKISLRRKEEGKGANSYLVLNLDDEINLIDAKYSIVAQIMVKDKPYKDILEYAMNIENQKEQTK